MNAFEEIVKQYLEAEGYWVRQSVKLKILKDDKKKIGLSSMPRPEIDIVALSVKRNELLLIEVKSYLDSPGVKCKALSSSDSKNSKRFRLFNNDIFREIVTQSLRKQYLGDGLINEETRVNYALAAGHISPTEELKIKEYFSASRRNWILFSPKDIKDRIRGFSERGWEDNLVTMTAKLTKEAIS